jgi:hypothetical protein
MKRTRVVPVKGTRNARTSLAFLVPRIGLLRAVYLRRMDYPVVKKNLISCWLLSCYS